jgi:hypothetical protein
MRFRKSSYAVAALALCAGLPASALAQSLPAPTSGTLEVWFKAPLGGQTVSGTLSGDKCYLKGYAATRVSFSLDGAALNSDTNMSDGMSCVLDTTKFPNGTHELRAIAYDSSGRSYTERVSVNIQNTTAPANTAPTVSITAPTANQTLSGSTLSYAANATDNAGVSRVEFRVDGSLVNSDASAPYGGSVSNLAAGMHTLTATAFDAAGLSSTSSVTFSVPQPTTSTPTTSLPAPTSGTLEVWFKAPLGGQTVSGTLSGDKCYVKGYAATRVSFSLDGSALNSDTNTADGMSCVLDTTKFPNGAHTLRAVAYDSSGRSYTEQVSINVQNSASTPPPTGDTAAPTVSITSPTANQTLSSSTVSFAASASDNTGVTKVEFRLDGTLVATDTTNSFGGSASNVAPGTHTLTATAYDAAGLSSTSSVTFSVASTSGGTTTPPPTSSLPSTGVRAVPTFHSIGLYWSSPGGSSGCKVQYRAAGESAWKEGYPMWYDSRNNECRGSLVHLNPGTNYEVQLGLQGQSSFARGIVTKTWSEQFPIARTVYVQPGQTLNITEGGSASGYVLYTPAPGTSGVIDSQNAQDHNVRISTRYVIVRGFTLRGARTDAIRMYPGASDVVIENNNISGWGRSRSGSLGVDMESAVRARCDSTFQLQRTVIQNNVISNPRYGSNSWSSGHPEGPQGISYWSCGANHVFRYNRITSTTGKYYNDIIGGGSNFSSAGFPFADTDIYGNHLANGYDDGIEAEGANRNVRIWGNYIDDTYIAIASTATSVGPLYVFRNLYAKGGTFGKSGQKNGYGEGRRYFFHNTILQPSGAGASAGIKGNTNEPMTNSISRNNVWHMRSSGNMAIGVIGGSANNFDWDMSNGNMTPYSGAERNGIAATPTYASGHGPASGAGGYYQLSTSSRGYDAGERLPNFNDNFLGSRPDMGAHETGSAQMKFGPR